MKKVKFFAAVFLAVSILSSVVNAAEPTCYSYFYNRSGNKVVCPAPYSVINTVGCDFGIMKPGDMAVCGDKIYILDLADGHIAVLDGEYKKVGEITPTYDGAPYIFKEPKGFWVTNGEIYIADRSAQSVIRCDINGSVNKIYGKPEIGNTEKDDYLPLDVVTDSLGNIYVLAENEYRGLIVTDSKGDFKGYFGANTVETTYQVIMDNLWRKYFLTETQIESSSRNLPSPYISVFEKDGFVYTSNSGKTGKIHKLNYNGNNILNPSGDSGTCDSDPNSSFISVCADDRGFFTAMDGEERLLYQYDGDGNLLFVFGGLGRQAGCFTEPVSVCAFGEELLVLDASTASVTVFSPTEFGNSVRSLKGYETAGSYDKAYKSANDILSICNEYETAYFSLGEYAYSEGKYDDSMAYFKKCGNQSGFSKAFAEKRTAVMRSAFPIIVLAVAAIWILTLIYRHLRKKDKKKGYYRADPDGKIKYAFHTVFHPIEGFSELRYNKRYSMMTANVLYVLSFFVSMLNFLFTGFSFSSNSAADFNLFTQLAGTVGVMLLFVVSSRFVATFLGGIGTFREIWITVGYAQIPMILGNIVYTVLSNVLTQEEGVFLGYLLTVTVAYTYIMMFFAVMGVNMYGFVQCVFSIICTLFGMIVCVFLVFLIFNLTVELMNFFETVFREIMYRINVGF